MEIAPLGPGGYESANNEHTCGAFVDWVLANALGKSVKYGNKLGKPAWLLIYVTDWHFMIPPSALALLRLAFIKAAHNFEQIFLFTVRDENGGLLSKVNGAPAAEITQWWGQEQKLRAVRFRNISLAQATPNEDGSFTLLEVPLNS